MALHEAKAGLAILALGALGCRALAPPPAPHDLLWHGDPPFELLVETRRLAPPPDLAGNRFLSGWRGWRDGKRVLYAQTRDWSRLEIVDLGGGSRELLLDLEGVMPGDPRHATVRIGGRGGGRELPAIALSDPLRVPLPADLPLGRVPIDLRLEGEVAVSGAGLSSSLPAGEARLEGEDLLQSGDSLVELFARPADGGEKTLRGSFVPPKGAQPGQRFVLSVDDAHGAEQARFAWTPGRAATLDLTLALPADGAVRVRLLARGQGPPARWRALHIENAARSAEPAVSADRAEPAQPAGTATEMQPPRLIVVYLLDALRADRVGHLRLQGAGNDPLRTVRSPTIDRLAREGLTFTVHHSVAPNTLPSTKSLFSGRTWRAGGGSMLPAELPTLAELMHGAGYRTAIVSGNQNVSPTYGMVRGFDFDAPGVKFPPTDREPVFNDNAARAGRAAIEWIHSLGPGDRGFLYVHVIHPHNPYFPPPDLERLFTAGIASRIKGDTNTLRALDRGTKQATPADRERVKGLYAASLAYADRELGGLIEEATRNRAPGEVVVAVTADHGEELFEHGGVLHGYTLYEEMLHIPLVLWSPGRIAPQRVEKPTDTLDLFATLLDLANATPPAGSSGHSLLAPRPAAEDERPRFAAASAVRGGIFAARWHTLKVALAPRSGLQWGMGGGAGHVRDPEFVFDLAADPEELTNLAGEPNIDAAWLRAELLRWMSAGSPELADAAQEPVLDAEERSRLKALGYLGD
ncbi:MAG: sulfatase [Acidobacteriota bacterium]